ncbi:MAG: VWA domain-containing protein [Defluviitaleaceae bacterium]|nr:VWA domain-containing protein [Defluviitaleaceae bacterium]
MVDPFLRWIVRLLSAGLLAIIVLGLLFLGRKAVLADENDFTYELIPIDAVLVLDVSRSMRTADPDRISRDAMNLFIEMLTDGRDRVGVVAYAGQVERSRELEVIYGQEDRASFRYFIDELEYASWTDHGLGLIEAVRILQEGFEEDRQSVIIFFTDGNLNVNPNSSRSNAMAQEDVETAILISQTYGFPIYTIGLNFDGNLDIEYIREIADATGGLTFETANAEDLPEIMRAIFAAMISAPPEALIEDIQPLPTPPPTPYPTPEPMFMVEEILPEPTYTNGHLWLLGIGLGVFLLAILIRLWVKPRRVFTGRLFIDVIHIENREAKPLIHRNLIEYGKKTTLLRLVGDDYAPAFDYVKLLPCPKSPSHLPKLFIRCKNPQIKLTKDFLQQDAEKGISISIGSEISVTFENVQIHLKYIA